MGADHSQCSLLGNEEDVPPFESEDEFGLEKGKHFDFVQVLIRQHATTLIALKVRTFSVVFRAREMSGYAFELVSLFAKVEVDCIKNYFFHNDGKKLPCCKNPSIGDVLTMQLVPEIFVPNMDSKFSDEL